MPTAVLEPEIAHKRRKITVSDANEVANLVANRMLNETEACALLDIPRDNWYKWKTRNKNLVRFDQTYTRLKAAKIAQCINRIDQCGDGIGLKQPDWRAKAYLLHVTDRERFGTEKRDSGPVTHSTVNVMVMSQALDKLLPAAEPVKALSNTVIDNESKNPQPA